MPGLPPKYKTKRCKRCKVAPVEEVVDGIVIQKVKVCQEGYHPPCHGSDNNMNPKCMNIPSIRKRRKLEAEKQQELVQDIDEQAEVAEANVEGSDAKQEGVSLRDDVRAVPRPPMTL